MYVQIFSLLTVVSHACKLLCQNGQIEIAATFN